MRYQILGDDIQFVELELDPGEYALSEAGAMMYMTAGIEMQTQLGYGTEKSFLGKVFSAGKRVLSGNSLFLTSFKNTTGGAVGRAAFAAPYPGKIIALSLGEVGSFLCQRDSYLCSGAGVEVSIAFTKRFGAGLFGGEGFILERLVGDGLAFVHAGGAIRELELRAGETIRIDTGCIVAFQEGVQYDISFVGNIKSALFSGEGLFFATLTGPGKVYLQSLPFSRMVNRILQAIPRPKEEGNILSNFGLGRNS